MNALLQAIDAASTPIVALLCWIVWSIKTNDLSHIHDDIRSIAERLARLEGGDDADSEGHASVSRYRRKH